MSVEKIYEQVAAAGRPLTLSAPWQALQVDRNFFRIDHSLETLCDDLLKKFEPRLLIESGLFTTSHGGDAVVNPLVFSPQTVFWALRPAADAPPFQLIADQRSLRRSDRHCARSSARTRRKPDSKRRRTVSQSPSR